MTMTTMPKGIATFAPKIQRIRCDKGGHHNYPSNRLSHKQLSVRHLRGETKQIVLQRDTRCALCGTTRQLDVHHLDTRGPHLTEHPNNSLDNLIALCHRCHLGLHFGIWAAGNRAKEITRRREVGEGLAGIGRSYGISRQRVFQIIQRISP